MYSNLRFVCPRANLDSSFVRNSSSSSSAMSVATFRGVRIGEMNNLFSPGRVMWTLTFGAVSHLGRTTGGLVKSWMSVPAPSHVRQVVDSRSRPTTRTVTEVVVHAHSITKIRTIRSLPKDFLSSRENRLRRSSGNNLRSHGCWSLNRRQIQ